VNAARAVGKSGMPMIARTAWRRRVTVVLGEDRSGDEDVDDRGRGRQNEHRRREYQHLGSRDRQAGRVNLLV